MRKLRHYWNSQKRVCDCGCTKRVWISNQWNCAEKVLEALKEQGVELTG
jgi:hypothetical protein